VLQEKAGDLTFPGAKKPPTTSHDAWRWFDFQLKGLTNGLEREPAVAYYVMGDVSDSTAPGNVWRTAAQWPPLPTTPTRYYFHADRALSPGAPGNEPAITYTYDPANPAQTIGGLQLTLPAGPKEQQPVESRPDVVVFTSEPLGEPLEVTGRVAVKLWVSSEAPDTDFVAKLCDVYPDGRSFNICEGQIRARFRKSFAKEALLKPGKVYPLPIDLWSTSIIFNRGHRLRVQVTSSSAPGYDPNPNTGEPFRASDRKQAARNTIYVDARRPSHLLLPVVTAAAAASRPPVSR
jgi:putative CocE/NonD family hydrolase